MLNFKFKFILFFAGNLILKIMINFYNIIKMINNAIKIKTFIKKLIR